MNEKEYIGIFLITLLCLTISLPFVFLWVAQNNFVKPDVVKVDAGRNENSTPRTFILPANPAVAAEQEEKIKIIENRDQIQRCIIALVDRGYSFDNVENITSDEVLFATMRYQFSFDLEPTGKFDERTRVSLTC